MSERSSFSSWLETSAQNRNTIRDAQIHRRDQVVSIASEYYSGSNLIHQFEPLTPQDIQATEQMFTEVLPITDKSWKLVAHRRLATTFALEIAQALKEKNPELFEDVDPLAQAAAAQLHDFGRVITHSWGRHDVITGNLLDRLNIRPEVAEALVPPPKIFRGKDPSNQQEVEEIALRFTPQQIIMHLADFCGKPSDDGLGIKTFEEVLYYHLEGLKNYDQTRGIDIVFPSQLAKDEKLIEFAAKVYQYHRQWLAVQGVDVEEIRQKILRERENQPIQKVIFDLGGVVIPFDPSIDSGIKHSLQQYYDVSGELVDSSWEMLIPQLQTGKLPPKEFWKQWATAMGQPDNLPENRDVLLRGNLVGVVKPEMVRLIQNIQDQGYKTPVHTDTVYAHHEFLRKQGVWDLFNDTIIASHEIGLKKTKHEAFIIAALILGVAPSTCVFIDDREGNVTQANKAGMHGIQFHSPEQLRNDLSALIEL